jgi:Peptidase A4 family
MQLFRNGAIIASLIAVACTGLTTATADASGTASSLSRPLVRVSGGPVEGANGINVLYSSNWSGYAALPSTAGQTFTSIVANYNVPSVTCSATPDTFSFHWIGLDGWADQTVEQDGISANCRGSSPHYSAWYEMYPANSKWEFKVSPGDAIESSIRYLGHTRYELSMKDVTSGQGFDVVQPCPVSACENSSAEAITEAYYYNRQFAGTSDFGDEHYEGAIVTDNAGNVGGIFYPKAWKTGEGIALGEYGDVDTTPGPIASAHGLGASSAFSVFWSREN